MDSSYEKLSIGLKNKKNVPEEAQFLFSKQLEFAKTHIKKVQIFRKMIFDLDSITN
jgi:hypothetical protein